MAPSVIQVSVLPIKQPGQQFLKDAYRWLKLKAYPG